MTDQICSQAQVGKIAGELNAGHREQAMSDLNTCTVHLGAASEYGQFMKDNGAKVLSGDVAATAQADTSFAKLANDERQMWQSISAAAQGEDPHGLCKLTIVEDKNNGPHAEISGQNCR